MHGRVFFSPFFRNHADEEGRSPFRRLRPRILIGLLSNFSILEAEWRSLCYRYHPGMLGA
jgi:hypothetical protein